MNRSNVLIGTVPMILKEKYEYFPLYSRTGLLRNEYKIYPWLKNQKF